jgi:hypothetical protein
MIAVHGRRAEKIPSRSSSTSRFASGPKRFTILRSGVACMTALP